MQLHWLAKKMIDEFDPQRGHVFFSLPFIRSIHSAHGWQPALRWVSSIIESRVQVSDLTRQAFRLANNSIDEPSIDELKNLDEQAWELWNSNSKPNCFQDRALANFTWAVMAYICIYHDFAYSCTSSTVKFSSKRFTREQFVERSASSALNLAMNKALSHSKDLQRQVATEFSREIDLLGEGVL